MLPLGVKMHCNRARDDQTVALFQLVTTQNDFHMNNHPRSVGHKGIVKSS